MLIVGEQASSILRNHISVPATLSIQREMIGISILGTSHLGHPSSPDSPDSPDSPEHSELFSQRVCETEQREKRM